jgi:hypothetical protein
MSIIINVEQSPLTITPSNAEHIFTLSSTGYTLSNFKYVVDIYFKAQGQSEELSSRLKVGPNSYGKAIMDVGEVIRTFLNANPRFSGETYPYLNYVAEENSVITLADAQKTRDYNAYNLWAGGSPNANLEQLWHVSQYRCVVGCEYASGSTIVTDVNPIASFQPDYITIFPGVDNSLIPEPYLGAATLGSGYTGSANFFQVDNQGWYYYDLFTHVYQKPNAKECHNYEFTNTDIFVVAYITFTTCENQTSSYSINPGDTANWCALEGSVVVVDGNPNDLVDNGICEGYNPVTDCPGPKKFMNAAGETNCAVVQSDGVSVTNVRRRMHHPDCPIIVSFLNGKNDYFTNDIYSVAIRGALDHGDPYTYSAESQNRTFTTLPVVEEPVNSTFKMLNFYLPYNVTSGNTLNAIPTDAKKVCFYGTSYDSNVNNRLNIASATTEVLEFWMQPKDCINTPVHVLFMNSNGMWDTYTLGKKSTRTINLERKNYQQESSLNKQFYARGSSQRGAHHIYETNADYTWDCNTWFMDDADTQIMQELFMSQDVYIITGTTIQPQNCQSCLQEIRLYQHLIPVVVTQKDFTVYEQKYQKIFQYNLTLHWGSVKRFRTQG